MPRSPLRATRSGFTMIELLVVISIIAVLLALLMPAVQSGREAARRAQCANNLKQLALATANYAEQVGVFPMGVYQVATDQTGWWNTSHSCFVAILPFLDQAPLFNAVNFRESISVDPENYTVRGVGLSTLWCPSDPSVSQAVTNPNFADPNHPIAFSSYAGSAGPWFSYAWPPACRPDYDFKGAVANMPGVIGYFSSVSPKAIRDGMSNTFLFGERAHGLLAPGDRDNYHMWFYGGITAQTLFSTTYPMNPQRKIANFGDLTSAGTVAVVSASSFHPEGANFAFCDGSVRFVKDSVSSWPISPTGQAPIVQKTNYTFDYAPGAAPGVYQALSTRNRREIISADSF